MILPDIIRSFVHRYASALGRDYTFDMNPTSLHAGTKLRVMGATPFDRNIDLKLKLATAWRSGDIEYRKVLAHYYVSTWGGIRRNSPDRLAQYVDHASRDAVPPFRGIASWSKVMTAADPTRYAIFDARVSFTLNAIQLDAASRDAIRFPALPTRNKALGIAMPKLLRQAAAQPHWGAIDKDDVYTAYLELLRHSAVGLPGPLPLATAEMVLFARAPDLAQAYLAKHG